MQQIGPNPPMPAADSADVQAVWQLMHTVNTSLAQPSDAAQNDAGTPALGIDSSIIAHVCSPGAVIQAVFFRTASVDVMQRQGLLSPWQQGADLNPAVFQVIATIPIGSLEEFDPDDFFAKLREPSGPH